MNELINELSDFSAQLASHAKRSGLDAGPAWCESQKALIDKAIAALSAQPSPDAAQVSNPFHPNSFEHAYWQQGWDARDRAPQPVQAVAESVADEARFEDLLKIFAGVLYTQGFHRAQSRYEHFDYAKLAPNETDALRTFFKQSRQSPRAGMVSVSRDDLEKVLFEPEDTEARERVQSALSHSSKGDEHGQR